VQRDVFEAITPSDLRASKRTFIAMANITIDDKEYDLEKLSDATKAQLTSMRLADAEIQRLNIQLAIAQTARNAYALAVRKDLEELEGAKK
jgi:hypothetical protein